jgi:hypothetical protein
MAFVALRVPFVSFSLLICGPGRAGSDVQRVVILEDDLEVAPDFFS